MVRKTYGKESLAKRVVNKIISDKNIKLFVDQNNDSYIAPNGDGTEVYNLESKEARDWLTMYTMDNFDNNILLHEAPKDVLETLCGYAKKFSSGKRRLELRTYMDDDKNIWYDLGRSAVKITPKGWKIVLDPPIMFVRNFSQEPQVFPERGGDIWKLFDHINIKDKQDQLLVISYLIAGMIPGSNKPILALSGPAGCGKSECTKTLKSLMDPTVPPNLPPMTNIDELNKLALTSQVMAFDNLSTMNARIADQFCRLATGSGVRIRKLYKTNDYITFEAIRPLIVNGISQVITQSDLLNRTVLVELSPIEKRITDDELRQNFEQARPYLLGAMFDLLSKALAIHPKIARMDREWPRMGAFAKWGYAVCEALGGGISGESFMEAYKKVERIQHDEALHANPLAAAIEWFMSDKDVWAGSMGELLNEVDYSDEKRMPVELKYLSKSPFWPTNPRSASANLRRSISDFKAMGLIIIPPRNSNRTFYILNTSLPVRKLIDENMLDLLVPNVPKGVDATVATYRNLGYTVEDLALLHPYAADSDYVEKRNGGLYLRHEVLNGTVILPAKDKPIPEPEDADRRYECIARHIRDQFDKIDDHRGLATPSENLARAKEIGVGYVDLDNCPF